MSAAELAELVRERRAERAAVIARKPSTWREWAELAETGGRTERQSALAVKRLAGYLLARDVDPAVALALLQSWDLTRNWPPLGLAAVERLVREVAGKHADELERRNRV